MISNLNHHTPSVSSLFSTYITQENQQESEGYDSRGRIQSAEVSMSSGSRHCKYIIRGQMRRIPRHLSDNVACSPWNMCMGDLFALSSAIYLRLLCYFENQFNPMTQYFVIIRKPGGFHRWFFNSMPLSTYKYPLRSTTKTRARQTNPPG